MTDYIWYYSLAAVSFITGLWVIIQKRKTYPVSTMMIYYLFATGITWIGEFIVLGIFHSYEYKTGLYDSIWAQSLIGHLLLNTTMFPAAGLIMVTNSRSYLRSALIAAVFVVIEYLFHELGIYVQHWWRYYMSAVNLFIFEAVSRIWFNKMVRPFRRSTRAVVLYFVGMVIIHLPSPLLLLYGRMNYTMEWIYQMVHDIYITSIIISFFLHLLESLLLVLVACILKNPLWKLVPFIISAAVQTLFARTGIMVVNHGWKPIYTILVSALSITVFYLIEKSSLKLLVEDSTDAR